MREEKVWAKMPDGEMKEITLAFDDAFSESLKEQGATQEEIAQLIAEIKEKMLDGTFFTEATPIEDDDSE